VIKPVAQGARFRRLPERVVIDETAGVLRNARESMMRVVGPSGRTDPARKTRASKRCTRTRRCNAQTTTFPRLVARL
jgi:hypothetical protein